MSTRQPPEDKSVNLVIELTAPQRPSPGLSASLLRMQALEQAWEEDPSEFLQRLDELAHDIEQALARMAGLPAAMVSADPAHHGDVNRAQADRFHDADR